MTALDRAYDKLKEKDHGLEFLVRILLSYQDCRGFLKAKRGFTYKLAVEGR